ncbi:MAG: signal peptide peptidase SppA, partial [Chloroflexota bacterium]
FLASACDQIILPPSGRLSVLGLRSEVLFLQETLSMAGIEADLESIAEYKVTSNMFRCNSMTAPHREMLNSILDSVFDTVVTAISEGRDMSSEDARRLIDSMPMMPADALKAGLIDGTLYEDELPAHLAAEAEEASPGSRGTETTNRVPLVTWDQAARWLKQPLSWTTRNRIGVISLKGMIVPGKSRRMPAPVPLPIQAQAGAETLTAALRQAEADPLISAVILHVDSPGGSSLASDLIWRQVQRLGRQKPVVVLMGEQAASGGYYLSAPARHIVARPTTLTGSIGIWGGKFIVDDLYERLKVGRQELQRGARADLYTELRPFDEEEREQVRRELEETYARFKQVVVQGRDLTEEDVEALARGRVWTGEQAASLGLVDELGDFETALEAAKALADLDPDRDYSIVEIAPPRQEILPQPFPPPDRTRYTVLRDWLEELAGEHLWAMAPWSIRWRG